MSEIKGYQNQPKYTAAELEQRRRARAAAIAAAAAELGPENAQPQQQADHADEAMEVEEADRLLDIRWCNCGHCDRVPANASLRMCICCQEQEFDGLTEKLDGPNHCIPCISLHKEFNAICLTEGVLRMVEARSKHHRGYGVKEGWTNRLFRLLAYQCYTFWVHGYLGKGNRRVIPACVVNKIRDTWPDPNNNYVSYKDSDGDELFDAWRL